MLQGNEGLGQSNGFYLHKSTSKSSETQLSFIVVAFPPGIYFVVEFKNYNPVHVNISKTEDTF